MNGFGMLHYVVPLLITCILGVAGVVEIEPHEDVWIVRSTTSLDDSLWSGCTYGGFIFVQNNEDFSHLNTYQEFESWALQHEYGHVLQQQILHEWYLSLVAIPSLITITLSSNIHRKTLWELWANQLSGFDPNKELSL